MLGGNLQFYIESREYLPQRVTFKQKPVTIQGLGHMTIVESLPRQFNNLETGLRDKGPGRPVWSNRDQKDKVHKVVGSTSFKQWPLNGESPCLSPSPRTNLSLKLTDRSSHSLFLWAVKVKSERYLRWMTPLHMNKTSEMESVCYWKTAESILHLWSESWWLVVAVKFKIKPSRETEEREMIHMLLSPNNWANICFRDLRYCQGWLAVQEESI